MENKRSFVEIHMAVLLFGLAGIFGKLINLSPIVIVFGRTFFAFIFLAFLIFYLKIGFKLESKKDFLLLVIMGIILSVHWVTFFKSIQLSTVAIGLLTFSTFPVFVTFLEPVFFKNKLAARDFIVAGITFAGIIMVVPNYEFNNGMTLGAIFGVVSGFTFSILSVLNKKYVSKYSSLVISFYENITSSIVLFPFIFLVKPEFTLKSVLLLVILGIVFTGISHSLYIHSMSSIRAYTASIISCLEPVYGIIAGVIILGEIPELRTVLGGIVILGTVFYSTIKGR